MRLLAFPFHDWRKQEREGIRTRDGHLLEWFARDRRIEKIIVVDRPLSLLERAARRYPARVSGELVCEARVGSWRGLLTRVSDRLEVLDVLTRDVAGPALHGRAWWFQAFAAPEMAALTTWAVRLRRLEPYSVVAWTPTAAPLVRNLGSPPILYDSLDNWLIHPALRRHAARARAAYDDLLPTARSVVVSAPASKSALSPWRREIEVVPNGVDPNTFSARHARPADLPPRPIVGYAGKLASRIDSELVRDTAARLPHVSFCFVGPILEGRAVRLLTSIPNVHLLGDRHYSLIPAYLQAFDVAWIPHRVGEGETGGDPIKLYEYWAAGLPVVATRIDGLDRFREKLRLIDGATDAALAIDELLASDPAPRSPIVPPDRTWRVIATRLLDALAEAPG